MQAAVLFAAENDGAGAVDRLGVGKMNAALRAFDHRFRTIIRVDVLRLAWRFCRRGG